MLPCGVWTPRWKCVVISVPHSSSTPWSWSAFRSIRRNRFRARTSSKMIAFRFPRFITWYVPPRICGRNGLGMACLYPNALPNRPRVNSFGKSKVRAPTRRASTRLLPRRPTNPIAVLENRAASGWILGSESSANSVSGSDPDPESIPFPGQTPIRKRFRFRVRPRNGIRGWRAPRRR